jgi:hypothetical protein
LKTNNNQVFLGIDRLTLKGVASVLSMKKISLSLLFIGASLLAVDSARSEDATVWRYRSIEVIDTPTAEVVDHYGYHVSFRFGKDGNLQNRSLFGVFPRLNMGFGLDGENIIGTGDSRLNKPTINVKFRLFDGKGIIPAFAMGYDGQGYVWNKAADEYEQREKGFYVVTTMEIVVPEMFLSLGVNRFDFDEGDSTRGFLGWSYIYQQIFGFMAEWDHATEYEERRVNYGIKYFVTPVFTVDLAGRNIPERPGSTSRETERIVRLTYTGTF